MVFMGYVTSKPDSKEYQELINAGNMKDIDETDRKRFCEYIMYRGLIRYWVCTCEQCLHVSYISTALTACIQYLRQVEVNDIIKYS